MTNEELLIARWEVIGDYPNSTYNVGDILTDNGKDAVINQDGVPVFVQKWGEYPNIFKSLDWWEKRDAGELPKYLRNKKRQWVARVDHYLIKTVSLHDYVWQNLEDMYPATEEEFLAYQKSIS